MKTVYDVMQLLKRFGIFVYLGNRLDDIELMQLELAELYQNKLLSAQEYANSIGILKREAVIVQEQEERKKDL